MYHKQEIGVMYPIQSLDSNSSLLLNSEIQAIFMPLILALTLGSG